MKNRRAGDLPPLGLRDYGGDLGNTAMVKRLMGELQRLLIEELGSLPDAVLVLRTSDGQCSTLFGANPENLMPDAHNPDGVIDPRFLMTSILEEAVKQNHAVNAEIKRRRTQ